MTAKLSETEIRALSSKLYHLCSILFPDEFNQIFTSTMEAFRDWLNAKTGLNEDHIKDKPNALNNWVKRLDEMLQEGKP